jgi:hypothetical protein
MNIRLLISATALAAALSLSQAALAQGPRGARGPRMPQNGEQAAPIDLTGYWVSVVTEDWRWRMLTPPHGDYASVPLNPVGKKIADSFDPSRYAPGQIDCRAYGAAGLMRMPTRVHISWADSNTLKLQSDWGEQTRMIHFIPGHPVGVAMMGDDSNMPPPGMAGEGGPGGRQDAAPAAPSPQGTSIAIWQLPYQINANVGERGVQRGGFGFARGPAAPLPGGDLRVVTFNLAPGWLRRNGVPYGAHTRMVEYYQTFTDPTGKKWFDVTTNVEDPEYLTAPFITSDDFRSEPDGANWAPHPCKQIAQQ